MNKSCCPFLSFQMSFRTLSTSIKNDTIICQGDQVILDLDLPTSSYLWSTGETTSSITVSPNSSSFYWVLTDNNCYNSITIFCPTIFLLQLLLKLCVRAACAKFLSP